MSALITESELAEAQRLQIANIRAKLAAGKTLTARESTMLSQAAAGADVGLENHVRTYDELADRLNCTRRHINNLQRKFPDHPQPRPDGRHDVEAWRTFFSKYGIKSQAEEPKTQAEWKSRELELKCERLEIENNKRAGALVDVADVETGLASVLMAVNQALTTLVGELSEKVLHISDHDEAEKVIQAEVNKVKRIIQRCDFLEKIKSAAAATEAASVEVDAEEEIRAFQPPQVKQRSNPKKKP